VFLFPLQPLSETFLILRRTERDMFKTIYIGLSVKCRYSCQILRDLEFSRHIFQKLSNIRFHEYPPVGAELFHANGQTDRHDEVSIAFRNFANAPKNKHYRKIGRIRSYSNLGCDSV